ncbi:hypothetical protein [Paenibacillus xylanexedens]|uniref:hypothetical protein n=1 Tax=Paenibacillus xylanexedens TaxID=528191 RepID=UPI0028E82382|nr:hypothetical protein [Paenibacillus xylanexedens]
MTNINKLDNLLEGDKDKFLEVFSKVSQGTATYQDLSEIMRIAQQNARVFDPFDLALILRIAELQNCTSGNLEKLVTDTSKKT